MEIILDETMIVKKGIFKKNPKDKVEDGSSIEESYIIKLGDSYVKR